MSPQELTRKISAKWIANYGIDSLSGNCGKLAALLEQAMVKHGYPGDWMSGHIQGQLGNHCWIETKNLILDPSAQQYGDLPLVIQKPASHYQGQRMYSF